MEEEEEAVFLYDTTLAIGEDSLGEVKSDGAEISGKESGRLEGVLFKRFIKENNVDEREDQVLHVDGSMEEEFLVLQVDSPPARSKADVQDAPGSSYEAHGVLGSSPAAEPPPWARTRKKNQRLLRSPLLRLHQEILDFLDFISPTPEEKSSRVKAIKAVSVVINSIWPRAKPELFGSCASSLYLPTSDIDMVVLDSGVSSPVDGLRALAKALQLKKMAKQLQIISKARVPIIKFVESESDIMFDISFDQANGPEAAKYIKEAVARWPSLKPLCIVLKIFLQQRELNEVYTGGIGSYALITMMMAHLQLHPSRQSRAGRPETLEPNLGSLLLDFLDLYGRALNMWEVGVSCRDGGCFYSKKATGKVDPNRPFLLSVEDPQDADNDICKNSFNILKIRSAFAAAFTKLTTPPFEDNGSANGGGGLLSRIVRLDKILTRRKQAETTTSPSLAATDNPSGLGERHGRGSEDNEEEEEEEFDEEIVGDKRGRHARGLGDSRKSKKSRGSAREGHSSGSSQHFAFKRKARYHRG